MKPLQNYIEEEIKKLSKLSKNGSFCLEKDCYCGGRKELSQSLHRIAEITASEIVPEKKQFGNEYDKKSNCDYNYVNGFNKAISDLQTKIKEFWI